MQNIWKDFLKRKELAALIIVVSAMIFNSLGMQQGGMEIATHYTEFGIIAGIIVDLHGSLRSGSLRVYSTAKRIWNV